MSVQWEGRRFGLPAAEETRINRDEPNPFFETLFNRNWDRVAAILARMLGDRDEADDLALEVFWRLYQRLDGSRVETVGDGWVFRVAINIGLNALRSRHRRKRYERAAGLEMLRNSTSPAPAAEVEQREARRQVRAILAEMSPRAARLLVLRAAGLSYFELANTLRLRETSVGALLGRAERDFERRYRERFGERDDETST